MTKPIIRIHDLELDEVIDREMTDAEFAQYEADKEAQAIALAESEAKSEAKSALFNKLGISEDEAKLLLS